MAIEQGIWKIGDKPEKLKPVGMADESLLEEQVMHDIAILNADWLLIGRQVRTDFDKFIDLLALDGDGNVVVIELKRDSLEAAFEARFGIALDRTDIQLNSAHQLVVVATKLDDRIPKSIRPGLTKTPNISCPLNGSIQWIGITQ